jgi:hypothetical protein
LVFGVLAADVRNASSAEAKPFMLVVTGVERSATNELIAVLGKILARNIPVACAIRLDDRAGVPPESLPPLMTLMRRNAGLVEIIVEIPGIALDPPYFQMRRASEAQNILSRAFQMPGVNDGVRPLSSSILTDQSVDPSQPPAGVRAAGFRCVLFSPMPEGAKGYWPAPAGVTQVFGGFEIGALFAGEGAPASLSAAIASNNAVVAYFPLAAYTGTSSRDLSLTASSLGKAITSEIANGRIYCTLPSQLRPKSSPQYQRCIALRVDGAPGRGPPGGEEKSFFAALNEAGLPFSYSAATANNSSGLVSWLGANGLGGREGFSICPALGREALVAGDRAAKDVALILRDISSFQSRAATCVTSPSSDPGPLATISQAGASTVTVQSAVASSFLGVDENGLLHVPSPFYLDERSSIRSAEQVAGAILRAIGPKGDALIAVTSDAVTTPHAQKSIVEALGRLTSAAENKFVDLEQYRASVMPADRAFELLESTKLENSLSESEPAYIDPVERAELLTDAELAWTYFSKLTNQRTGLAPATGSIDGGLAATGFPLVTMWDVGSTIMALIGAYRIGLIARQEFGERVETALVHLRDIEFNGLRLPNMQTSITGTDAVGSGYDSSDTGRLLVCLKILDKHISGQIDLGKLIARWNLQDTLIDGRLHNLNNGDFIDVHESNYANYLVRGFTGWGFKVEPAYAASSRDRATDAEMRLIYEVAKRGSVGTEPHVLEEVELGYSNVARIIADMLYTAQLREHTATGKLVCVSEGPIDREPWFAYQGYQFGADKDPWTIKTRDDLPKYQSPDFRRAIEMLSTEAAFLWAAARPQPYSRKLLSRVRERARIAGLGYSTGIFTATGQPMLNQSDINTNGIILESIAYILCGRQPLAEASPLPAAAP